MNHSKKIDKSSMQDIFSLSPMQEGMLLDYLKDPGSNNYFEQLSLHIQGDIDTQLFKNAWNKVLEINEMLRTGFRWEDIEHPVQVVLKSHSCDFEFHDLRENNNPVEALEAIKSADQKKGFDLYLPSFRIMLCHYGEEDYYMMVSNHHILYDGWSTGIILKEFFDIYNDLIDGGPSFEPIGKPRYKEFIKWLQSQNKKSRGTYWSDYLSDFHEPTLFPFTGAQIEPVESVNKYMYKCSDLTSTQLESAAKKRQVTIATFFYAAWGLLLQRYCGNDDVLYGLTVSGRPPQLPAMQKTVGLFINTIPMRVHSLPGETGEEMVSRLAHEFQSGSPFHHTSLAEIYSYYDADRSGGLALFDTLLVLENYPLAPDLTDNNNPLSINSYSMFEKTGFDLTVGIRLYDGIEIEFLYTPSRICKDNIQAMAGHLERLLNALVEQPRQDTRFLNMLSEEETRQLLLDFNKNEMKYPEAQPLHQLFSNQASRTPHRIALLGPGLENPSQFLQISYAQLHTQVRQTAQRLKSQGVNPQDIIALSMKRSVEAVVAILAILESGAAYMPINPSYPVERIDYMLRHSGARCMIDQTFYYQLEAAAPQESDPANIPNLSPDAPCYVHYTSGTTGRPNGVLVSHRNILNTLHWFAATFKIEPGVHLMQLTDYTFDPSVEDIFGTLLNGASLFFAHKELVLDKQRFQSYIRRHQIQVIDYVPQVLDELLSEGEPLSSLRTVISGGMALDEAIKNRLLARGYTLYNNYGPTETSVDALYSKCSSAPVSLGGPIANTHVYILDRHGRPVPIGVPGELIIQGPGVATGYLNNPQLTSERFLKDLLYQPPLDKPFYSAFSKRLAAGGFFKTGDRVRRLDGGNIQYLGRIDRQIKVRGYRIELEEIETLIHQFPGVREATVVFHQEEGSPHILCAYIAASKKIDKDRIKEYLSGKLPNYMVPGHYIQLAQIPKSPSGKIDTLKLPSPVLLNQEEPKYKPVNPYEKQIATIWQKTLNLSQIGRKDNFFDIGGNSLTILRVHSRINSHFETNIPVAVLFQHPTIQGLAAYLSAGHKDHGLSSSPDSSPSSQARPSAMFESIAVIGMAGRFPGARTIENFWQLLEKGQETIAFFSDLEMDNGGLTPEFRQQPGYVNAYGIARDMDYFDAAFFDYPPGDAALMDPQLRILHECTWEALEDAGYPPLDNEGRIGLFAGALINNQRLAYLAAGQTRFSSQTEIGSLNDRDFFCTRIAYKLNLRGPAITIQTACSTSLVAIDSACRALWTQQCDMVLAGGVAISPQNLYGYLYQEGMVHSPDGHCRAFDAQAGGTVGGNGAGIVLLKPLSNARADGDAIYAIIKGSAVNNDGLDKVGYTAPGVNGQAAVINDAIRMAAVPSETIGYIETHGTGTKLGDPIEIAGLKQVFGTSNDPDYKCALGTVKPNIGHLDAAAGIAGFIKTVLTLYHQLIPPTLHYQSPNPAIDFTDTPFYINTALLPWPTGPHPRRAGVSSFGIGGTNAHVILEEAPTLETQKETAPLQLLPISAKTHSALETMCLNLARHFQSQSHILLADAAFTLQTGRTRFRHRKALVCATLEEACATLEHPGDSDTYVAPDSPDPSVIFMFPGQGSQYLDMGRDLYRGEPLFKQELDRCMVILESLMDFDLKDLLYPTGAQGTGDSLTPTAIAQPVIFIIEYALAQLLINWGIHPAAMIGHSIGQYTAACLAGVFSLEATLALVVQRGNAMAQMPTGAMLSIALSSQEVEAFINAPLDLAAVNSSNRCVVSGPEEQIDVLAQQLAEKGIKTRKLHTIHAFHSSMMEPVMENFAQLVAGFNPQKPQIPIICNITGQPLTDEQAQEPAYWASHLRHTVKFADGIAYLLQDPASLFLEVGPGNTLSTFVNQHQSKTKAHNVVNLMPHPGETCNHHRYFYSRIGKLWLYGLEPDWRAFHPQSRKRLHLPTYPFRQQYFESLPISCLQVDESMAPILSPHTPPQREIQGERPELEALYEQAGDETEEKLVRIWRKLFGIKEPGIHDSFFDLGGDSLKAIALSSEIQEAFDTDLPLAEIFQRQTIRRIAQYLSQSLPLKTTTEDSHRLADEKNLYEPFPMTPIQVAYVMGRHDLFEIGGVSTHLYQEIEIDFDIQRFNRALNQMIKRHPMFRVVALPDGYQKFVDVESYDIEVEDLTAMNSQEREAILLEQRKQMSHHMYDPFCWPLFRFKAFKLEQEQYYILFSIDHLIADAASMLMFARELSEAVEKPELQPPPLHYSFRDYVLASRELKSGEKFERDKQYWLDKIKDFPTAPELPLKMKPSEVDKPHFKRLQAEFSHEDWQTLKQVSAEHNITFSTLLCTAYARVLSYWSGQTSLAINLTLFNRLPFHKDVDKIIGDFTSIILLGLDLAPAGDFWEQAVAIQRTLLEALDHRLYDGIEFMRELRRHRDSGTQAIMPIVFTSAAFEFNHQDEMVDEAFSLFEGHRDTGMAISQTSQVFIDCGVGQIKDRLELGWDYVEALFDEEVVHTMFHQFVATITAVIQGEETPPLQPPQNQQKIIQALNHPQLDALPQKTLHQLFSEQVQRTPHRIAITGPSNHIENHEVSITYAQLEHMVGRLAHQLKQKGVRQGIVAVQMDRTIEIVAAFLGILNAPAAYMPIDPDYPSDRIHYMLKDSAAALKVTGMQQDFYDFAFTFAEHNDSPAPSHQPHHSSYPEDPCYIIYTSGTTGRPKGSVIRHSNVVSLLANNPMLFDFNTSDTWTLFHSPCFDFSVWEMYVPLLSGAKLIVIPKTIARAPSAYLELLQCQQVTVLNQTPTAFAHLSAVEFKAPHKHLALRIVIFGGEALYPAMLAPWLEKYPNTRFINMFGITETTVHVTFKEITPSDIRLNSSNIGKPIPSLGIFILDRAGRPTPLGVAGELIVTGHGVAQGYLNRPQLTGEKFTPHPTIPGQQVYRSGDLVRLNLSGDLEYLGRIDRQVKIRGFRIEPGEIEGALGKIKHISATAVIVKQANNGENYLCAYYVAADEIEVATLRDHLTRSLADYMIPSYFIPLSQLPLTANGKLDIAALPEPTVVRERRHIAPTNHIEQTILEIWSQVLDIDITTISTEQSFFELGGHSLNATRMIDEIHHHLDIRLPLARVFETPTIKELALSLVTSDKERFTPLAAVEKREYYSLSSAQQRLYIMAQMEPLGTSYNLPFQVQLQGKLDRRRLETAFQKLIHRHESLRTSFIDIAGQPVQRVWETQGLHFQIHYYDSHTDAETVTDSFVQPFDLSAAPLLRVGLIQTGKDLHRLMVDIHHIIADEVSLDIFIADLKALYRGQSLPGIHLQYKDFSQWRGSSGEKERIKSQENYWLTQYSGPTPLLDLPIDYPRPVVRNSEGNAVVFQVPEEQTQQILQMVQSMGSTLYMVLLGMFNILLAKLSGQEEIVIGTPVAGRRHADLGQIIGMFVNTLAIKNHPLGSKNGQGFLAEVKENTLNAFENQEYPFEELVEQVVDERDPSRSPLFDVLFSLQNADIGAVETAVIETSANHHQGDIFPSGQISNNHGLTGIDSHTSKFDLSLDVFQEHDHLLFSFEFSTRLFKQDTIQRFNRYFQAIISQIMDSPEIEIRHIPLISQEEAQALLESINSSEPEYTQERTFHHCVSLQAQRTPNRIAVCGPSSMEGDRCNLQITYGFMQQQAEEGARSLQANGLGAGQIAAIKMRRSPQLIIALLAVLNTGAAYLPVDPGYPEERIDYMLRDSNAALCLDDMNYRSYMTEKNYSSLEGEESGSDTAYIIYTSGSTGRPKGVMVSHRQYVNIAYGWREAYRLDKMETILLQVASFSFDVFAGDMARGLLSGGRTVICPDAVRTDLEQFHHLLLEQRITLFESTPALIFPLMEYIHQYRLNPGYLELLILGSDTCNLQDFKNLCQRFAHRMRIINSYGLTEATIDSSYYEAGAGHSQLNTVSGTVPIGKPFANTQMYILDSGGNLQPPGISGELYIGGPGVAQGYLNKPQITHQSFQSTTVKRFCPAFFKKLATGGFLFKTGDRARYLVDGNIEFLGRLDTQVKIRGFRIECGEIENQLKQHPMVQEAVVTIHKIQNSDAVLCAYIVPRSDASQVIDSSDIQQYLAGCLPAYMVPAHIQVLEKIPLSPSGKVDHRQLPIPTGQIVGTQETPRDALETSLVQIWHSVLDRDPAGIDENFFSAGGHSLKATVMILKVHKQLGIKIPLTELFNGPTIRGLARYIRNSDPQHYTAVTTIEQKEYYPVSPAQKRLYILQQLAPHSTAYNMPDLISLAYVENIQTILMQLIERHESLRTSFHMIDEQPVQKIHNTGDIDIIIPHYQQSPSEVVGEFIRPFDLTRAPLMRAAIYEKPGSSTRVLLLDMHHIIADGISQELLSRDLLALLNHNSLAPRGIQYKEYVYWQNSPQQQGALQQQENYWLEQFRDQAPVLELPLDYARPPVQDFSGSTIDFSLSSLQTRGLEQLALQQGTTPFMMLLAIYSLLMSKLSTQEDIVVGSPMAGRRHIDLENVVGMFVNTIPLRSFPSGEKLFLDYLKEITGNTLKAFENQDYPFEQLVEKVTVERNLARNPLFDVMWVLQNFNTAPASEENPALESSTESIFQDFGNLFQTAKFDLTLTGVEIDTQLHFTFEYSSKLFKASTIHTFIANFKTLVSLIIQEPNQRISSYQIISSQEKRRLLYDFNNTRHEFPSSKTIPQLFSQQVARTPHRIALVSPVGQLTYGELDRRSDMLATALREQGVVADTCVGLMLPRSLEMIISVYAILKAGAAYLPIDPGYPSDRIDYMLKDSNASLCLDEKSFREYNSYKTNTLLRGELRGEDNRNNAVYVIYTSGSTGKPKGVIVETRSFVNLLSWYIRELSIDERDNNLLVAPISFDLAQKNMYATLFQGGRLTLSAAGIPDYEHLTKIINTQFVTIINCAPSVFYPLVELNRQDEYRPLQSLGEVVLGGEPIQREKLRPFVQSSAFSGEIVNTYGPTECTDIAAGYRIPAASFEQQQEIPIGAPIQNVAIYILDRYRNLLQIGIAGELCIGGTGLSRGYCNNPVLTAETFIHTPHLPNKTLYRTGDMALWQANGNARFVGRIDQQVKVRGLRIELGEIETCLRQHGEVRDAVVTVRQQTGGENYICAYLITSNREDKALQTHLSKSLPNYMIPACFVRLELIPLTPSGKVDKRALPLPQLEPGKNFTAPRDEVETQLAQLWADVLERTGAMDIDTGFFEMGGHSLKATVLVSRIHKTFNVKFQLAEIFQNATIRQMAQQMKASGKIAYNEIYHAEEREYYELSNAQRRLWILCQFDEDATTYNMPNAIIIDGVFNALAFSRALKGLIQRHESFRTLFITLNGQPHQKILKRLDYEPEHIDLRHLPSAAREEEARRLFFEIANATIDLETGPLFRFVLLRLQENRYVMVYCIHHLINDGWSQGVINNEFFSMYNSYCLNEKIALPLPRLQYRDYSLWHNGLNRAGHFDDAGRYWVEKFRDKPNGIELPFDYPRQPMQTFNGGLVSFVIDGDKTTTIQHLSRQKDVTLFIYMLTLFNVFLYRFSGQEDIIIGAPIANRKRPELYPLVGFLVNTLVYRSRVTPDITFNQLLNSVKKEALDCYQHQDYPFDLLMEKLDLDRDLSQSPIFNVMIAHNNTDSGDRELRMEGVELSLYPYSNEFNISRFDLIFIIDEIDDYMQLGLEYNSDLFDRATIQRLADNFMELIDHVIANTGETISELNIATADQYRTVTHDFNDTGRTFPRASLMQLFEGQVEEKGDQTAVFHDGETISYRQLNSQSNCLAHYLLTNHGVKPNQVIGISMDRSIEMIVVILAIIKSGAAYLAVDPTYPPERVKHVLKDSRAQLLIIDRKRPQLLGDYQGRLLEIPTLEEQLKQQPDHNPGILNRLTDTLYINYTSGSTGTPNGAMLSQDCLTNLIKWQNDSTTIDCSLRCLQFTSINFCVSFQEIMGTLTSGGELYLIGEVERQDIDYLMDFLSRKKINILFLPFSYLNFLFNESNRWDRDFQHDLKHIITAGEQLKVSSGLMRFLEVNPHIQLHNHYGSTEMHVVTSYTLSAADALKIPIPPAGKPIDNISIYILDPQLNPVPIGVYGELCVAGSTEILGYAFNKELSHQKMVSCATLSDIKLYRSGDIGRWLPDGNIQLRGRKDALVKVRGFRVEPGEIESRILAIPNIRECVVTVKEDGASQKYLTAYVSILDESIDAMEIRQVIGRRLPQYMVPKIVFLDKLPLMPNGKVDREKLPDPLDSPLEQVVRSTYRTCLKSLKDPATPTAPAAVRYEHPVEEKPEARLPVSDFHEFARQAGAEPGKVAIYTPQQQIYYGELMAASQRLGPHLTAIGASPRTTAALLGEQTPQMVAAMLALMEKGCRFVHIPPDTKPNEVDTLMKRRDVSFVLTQGEALDRYSYTALQGLSNGNSKIHRTPSRPPVQDLDSLPIPDRSLVNYEKYSRFIGITMVKDCMTLLSSRGCPYHCAYCHKIWPKKQLHRTAENIFQEVKLHYDLGVRRFAFLDDIFNLNIRNSSRFFQMILKHKMKIQIFFPSGLRGDILTPEFIDLMVEAGTVGISAALETASPRLQKLLGKHLNIEKLRQNLDYIAKKHPNIILELQTMHGFPTETEEEAMQTLDFVKSIHWLDFPYLHIVRIYPNTPMEELALAQGVSRESIHNSENMAYHEWAETSPFEHNFTRNYQAEFLHKYFLDPQRLRYVLNRQMKVLTEADMVQKYNSYLPEKIESLDQLLAVTGIQRHELKVKECVKDDAMKVPDLNEKLRSVFPVNRPDSDATRLLLLDLSQFFSGDGMLYDVVEAPLGLISLLSYLNRYLGNRLRGKIAKARADFDSYEQLSQLLEDFAPQVIGIRSLTYFNDFFHRTVAQIRRQCPGIPIISGGPYASSDYNSILQDRNIDLLIYGEGEVTFLEMMQQIIAHNGTLPPESMLKDIPGLIFIPELQKSDANGVREVVVVEDLLPAIPGIGQGEDEEVAMQTPPVLPTSVSFQFQTSASSLQQLLHPLTTGGALGLLPLTEEIKNGPLLALDIQRGERGATEVRALLKKEFDTGSLNKEKKDQPKGEVQLQLAKIWGELLAVDVPHIGVDDNFFELGGHSLKITVLTSKIHELFGVKLSMSEIFKNPTIRGISSYIQATHGQTSPDESGGIEPCETKEYYPLSYNQQRLWFLEHIQRGGSAYNLPGVVELKNAPDEHTIKEALYSLIRRHESLRTGFKIIADQPVQYIIPAQNVTFDIQRLDLSLLPPDQIRERQDELYAAQQEERFDLGSHIPLLRALLVKLETHRFELIFNMHHIITDGWSLEVMKQDFIRFYEGLKQRTPYEPEPLNVQYKEFADWNSRCLADTDIAQKVQQHWQEKIEKGFPVMNLPTIPGGDTNNSSGASYTTILNEQVLTKLNKLAAQQQTTLFTLLFSAYLMVISRMAQQPEVICSVISSGRENPLLRDVVGFFVNSLLFNTTVPPDLNYNSFLQQVNRQVVEMFQHQEYPPEQVFKELKMKYPQAPVSFNMLNISEDAGEMELDLNVPYHTPEVQDVKFDIEVYVTPYTTGIGIDWTYKKQMFTPNTIQYIASEYIKIIEAILTDPKKPLAHYNRFKKKQRFKRGLNAPPSVKPDSTDKEDHQRRKEYAGK
jgi:amino acid adenylation domain-containing protein